ncbi:hypothetical protein BAUCODRAFT_190167 [Baudoinia panamericana UAMH 10762]|uniref:Uncharacterized protein n=1 Tax=Baudoinia panamericana (strain UAMH 10762) TaxID=717646 RepID=M2MVF3_BAUPA|nr:uncharacterized protein BAUCODRAFT_190167 [Baudoinia panamericana UAMH 10762]EMD00947.1 hypothetical protein BAUCODRAFT_190167 [Baudoinia panamericana UAMH 10762]
MRENAHHGEQRQSRQEARDIDPRARFCWLTGDGSRMATAPAIPLLFHWPASCTGNSRQQQTVTTHVPIISSFRRCASSRSNSTFKPLSCSGNITASSFQHRSRAEVLVRQICRCLTT